jgi:hypothetical protein
MNRSARQQAGPFDIPQPQTRQYRFRIHCHRRLSPLRMSARERQTRLMLELQLHESVETMIFPQNVESSTELLNLAGKVGTGRGTDHLLAA